MKGLIVVIMAFALVLTATAAMAATETSALTVSASVSAACRITGVTNLDFGTYDPTDPANDDDGVGDFTFRCTKNTAYDLYIAGARTMTDGTDTLNFEMYQEVGRTTVWSSATPGITGTSASNAQDTRNIYGRITPMQDVGVGAYSGTVTVTIQY